MGLLVHAVTHRWRWGRILTLASGMAVIAAFGLFYCRDEPPPDDADLQIHSAHIPDEENGMVQLGKLDSKSLNFQDYARAHGVYMDAAKNITWGFSRNDTLVDAFLRSVAPETQGVDELLVLPHFEPIGNGNLYKQWPEQLGGGELGDVLAMRAQRRLQGGDYAGATDDVLRMRRLAQRFSEGYLSVTLLLTVTSINGNADRACAELLNDKVLPASELSRLQQAWETETPWAEIYRRGMMMAYLDASKSLGDPNVASYYIRYAPGGGKLNAWNDFLSAWLSFTLQPNKTRRMLAEVHRQAEHALEGIYAQRPPVPSMPDSNAESVIWLVMPNASGRCLATEVAGSLASDAFDGFVTEAGDRLVHTGLALRQYYNEHGVLPGNLTALEPKYMAVVPKDPYDGQPLRYDPGRHLVYAVGLKLKDHHGSQYLNMPSDPDDYEDPLWDYNQPTLELKFAEKSPL